MYLFSAGSWEEVLFGFIEVTGFGKKSSVPVVEIKPHAILKQWSDRDQVTYLVEGSMITLTVYRNNVGYLWRKQWDSIRD